MSTEPRRLSALVLTVAALVVAAPAPAQPAPPPNPLLETWTTPFDVPPFDRIKPEHFLPAFKEAIAQKRKEIDAIAGQPAAAHLREHDRGARERGRAARRRCRASFCDLTGAETNAALQAVNREVAPLLSALRDEVRLNDELFARVKAVYDKRATLKLTPISRTSWSRRRYKGFVRGGANLDAREEGAASARSTPRLSMLGAASSATTCCTTPTRYRLVIDKQEDLAGLPPSVVAAAADAATRPRTAGQVGLHAAGAEHLAVPPVRRQPRAAAADPRRLHDALRPRRRVGQQEDAGPHRGACASSARSCSATRPTPTTSSKRTWRRRRRASTTC